MVHDFPGFQVRKCLSSACGLRYPLIPGNHFGYNCPRCGAETHLVVENTRFEDRLYPETRIQNVGLEALLDNIRSAWNVGSMFRTADGAGLRFLHLCGITATPENPSVLKTSLGAEKYIRWQHDMDGVETAQRLVTEGKHLWALETGENALPLDEITLGDRDEPIVLVVGNEVCGIDPGLQDLCERVIYLPMYGIKRSYNVAVAFGIAVHQISLGLSQV